MYKILNEKIRTERKLQREEVIYFDENIDIRAEVNQEIVALIVEDFKMLLSQEKHEILKRYKDELLYEIFRSSFD